MLRALLSDPAQWRYGYELTAEVGLRSGSLYPILVRLSDRDLLEARWEPGSVAGRPPRHLYRLTAGGLDYARAHAAAPSAPASPRNVSRSPARRRVIGGVFVLALLVLAVARVVPAAARVLRGIRAGSGQCDRPAVVLAFAVGAMPAERAEWGRAMIGELDEARGSWSRWRFSLGCVRAVARMRARETLGGAHRDGVVVRGVVLAAVAAALALAAYGLVRYPLAGEDAWLGAGVVLPLALGYVLCALGLSRGMTPGAVLARRNGLLGGLAVGAAWLVVSFPTTALKEWVLVPLLIAVLAPAGVAVRTGRATRDARACTAAAIWCGLVGGLVVFVVSVTAAYLHQGGPFDAQLVRDFHASGAPDLTAYAIGSSLGTAVGLLLIVPTVALAGGSLAARRFSA